MAHRKLFLQPLNGLMSTGKNNRETSMFWWENLGFPVDFPFSQSIEPLKQPFELHSISGPAYSDHLQKPGVAALAGPRDRAPGHGSTYGTHLWRNDVSWDQEDEPCWLSLVVWVAQPPTTMKFWQGWPLPMRHHKMNPKSLSQTTATFQPNVYF